MLELPISFLTNLLTLRTQGLLAIMFQTPVNPLKKIVPLKTRTTQDLLPQGGLLLLGSLFRSGRDVQPRLDNAEPERFLLGQDFDTAFPPLGRGVCNVL